MCMAYLCFICLRTPSSFPLYPQSLSCSCSNFYMLISSFTTDICWVKTKSKETKPLSNLSSQSKEISVSLTFQLLGLNCTELPTFYISFRFPEYKVFILIISPLFLWAEYLSTELRKSCNSRRF